MLTHNQGWVATIPARSNVNAGHFHRQPTPPSMVYPGSPGHASTPYTATFHGRFNDLEARKYADRLPARGSRPPYSSALREFSSRSVHRSSSPVLAALRDQVVK